MSSYPCYLTQPYIEIACFYNNRISEIDNKIACIEKAIWGEEELRDKESVPLFKRVATCLAYSLAGIAAIIGSIVIAVFAVSLPPLWIASVALAMVGVALLCKGKNVIKQSNAYQVYDFDIKERQSYIEKLLKTKNQYLSEMKENEEEFQEKTKRYIDEAKKLLFFARV